MQSNLFQIIPHFLLICLSGTPSGHAKRVSSVANYRKANSPLEISSLEERFRTLTALSELHPSILPLSLKQYRQLVFPAPRNFSILVLFTPQGDDVDGEDNCDKCHEASAWWNHVAGIHFIQEWRRRQGQGSDVTGGEERMYFASVNVFPETFAKVKVPIDINQPNFVYFANTTSSKRGVINNTARIWKLNVSQFKNDEFPRRMHILDLITWIHECSGVFIDLRTEPPKLTPRGATAIWIFVFFGAYLVWRFCDLAWISEKMWNFVKGLNYDYIAVVITMWCTSGQMFNQIRQTGWAYYDDNRNMVFVSGSSGYQLQSESLLVMALYGANTYSMIQLIYQAQEASKDKRPISYHKGLFYFTSWVTSFVGVLHVAKLKG